MKRLLVTILLTCSLLYAAEMIVKEPLKPALHDATLAGNPVKDMNGVVCALLKINTDLVPFDGIDSNMRPVKVVNKTSRVWVYLSPGEKRLYLDKKGYARLIYDIPVTLESGVVYNMTILGGETASPTIPISIITEPPDAEKWLDGELLGTGKSFPVTRGSHRLEVKKTGFQSYRADIEVSDNRVLFDGIALKEIDLVEFVIKTEPDDVEVFIKGGSIGRTVQGMIGDFRYPGDYPIRLTKSGYLDIEETITITPDGKNEFTYTLVRNIGTLVLDIEPADAKVDIQGRDYSGQKRLELIPGNYEVRITKSGYLPQSRSVELGLGKTESIEATLVRNIGTLVLDIEPADAKVEINRRDYTGQQRVELPPDRYKITAEKPGWHPDEETVELKLGQTRTVQLKLVQMLGGLKLVVQPLSARCVLMQGEREIRSWEGNLFARDIPVGSYTLVVKADGFKSQEHPVKITENDLFDLRVILEEGSDHQDYTSPTGIEMIHVPAGSFQMGRTKGDGYDDERPVHTVNLDAFTIGQYEVTQKEWKAVMGNNPSFFKGDDRPVEQVSWYDAVEFCNKLSEKEGLEPCYSGSGDNIRCDFSANGYRLPTEAEWEFSARGATNTPDYLYAGSDTIGDVAWFWKNSGDESLSGEWDWDRIMVNSCQTHPVGQKQANGIGTYDQSGNVWEWCWDWDGSNSFDEQTNPSGPESGSYRVIRGGSWGEDSDICSVANRSVDGPLSSSSYGTLGFRLARTTR